jgi:hypothetical protein
VGWGPPAGLNNATATIRRVDEGNPDLLNWD